MPRSPTDAWKFAASLVLAGGLSLAIAGLVWLSHGAITEWRRSTTLLVEVRSQEMLALLAIALNRDMKGAQSSILALINERALDLDAPYDFADTFARAFARFPYPESFFVWRETRDADGLTYFFNRTDRRPAWDRESPPDNTYPVQVVRDPAAGRAILAQAREQAVFGRPFTMFETTVENVPYQIVVHFLYFASGDRRLFGLAGFAVNLSWVRREYFSQLTSQIARIGWADTTDDSRDEPSDLAIEIVDDSGVAVFATQPSHREANAGYSRSFPLVFLDPQLVSSLPSGRPAIHDWTVHVSPGSDRSLAAATKGSARTLSLISLAAAAAMLGLFFTVAAVRASTQLATMQTEFVSTVTHELKTPLTGIRLVSETLAKGRFASLETVHEYSVLLSHETERLTRLIDNLLAYASVRDLKQLNKFESVQVIDVVERSVESFDARIIATGTEIKLHVSKTLPPIWADRQAIQQALENLIDNAIKYSPRVPTISIRASMVDHEILIDVADHGVGIPDSERSRVFEKFYRGRTVSVGGSGLGLAFARRVVENHGGRIAISNVEGQGTTVSVRLPAST
jgi:signal transduction histidine kinase